MLTRFTHVKHENNTSITQLPGRYIFTTCLQEKYPDENKTKYQFK